MTDIYVVSNVWPDYRTDLVGAATDLDDAQAWADRYEAGGWASWAELERGWFRAPVNRHPAGLAAQNIRRIPLAGAHKLAAARQSETAAPLTRDQILAAATAVHDERGCSCDRRYLTSCPRFAAAILAGAKARKDAEGPTVREVTQAWSGLV